MVSFSLPAAGQRVFSRNCFYENENVASDYCKTEKSLIPGNLITIEFCESCTADGCNSGSYLVPLVTLMVLPVFAMFRR